MQISKRIKSMHRTSGQNLIEFCFILPILIFLTLGIFEVAMFWQDLNSIYSLNEEINANVALVDTGHMDLGDRCTAATEAITRLEARDSMISLNNPTYNSAAGIDDTSLVIDGQEPFALYRYASTNAVAGKPQIRLWVDCRNPFENGITTQIEFYHKTLIMRASIPRFDNPEPIVIIPDNVFIITPKLNTISHY